MYLKRLIFSFILILTLNPKNSTAQISLSLGPGISSYSGDVSGERFKNIGPAFNIEFWYQINRFIYLKSGASSYQINAEDIIFSRNRDFKATNFDGYSSLMIGGKPNWRLIPFVYAGFGITSNTPKYKIPTDNNNALLDARTLNTEGVQLPNTISFFIPGLGIKYRLNEKISLIADAGIRVLNSDTIDGLSAFIIDTNTLSPEAINYFNAIRPEGLNGATRFGNANPFKNDVYGLFNVKLLLEINKKIDNDTRHISCPTFYKR